MTTINGLTKEAMQAIVDGTITDADVVGDNLILTLHDGSTVDAGNVRGPVGAAGAPGAPGAGIGKGSAFPGSPTDGDFFVRTDQVGDPMYKYTDGAWVRIDERIGRGCSVIATTQQSFVNAVFQTFAFAGEVYDDLGMHDPAVNNSRLTIPAGYTGKWQFDAHVDWINASAGVKKAIGFRRDGGSYRGWNSSPGGGWAGGNPGDITGTTTVMSINAGSYVELVTLNGAATTDIANLEGVIFTATFLGNS